MIFKRIMDFFYKKQETPEIKNFSTTLTDTNAGVDKQEEFYTDLENVLRELKTATSISKKELNLINEHVFKVPLIHGDVFKFNKSMTDGMCFTIDNVNLKYDDNSNLIDAQIRLNEIVFDNIITLTVSVKEFHEIFNHLQIQPLNKKENT